MEQVTGRLAADFDGEVAANFFKKYTVFYVTLITHKNWELLKI